MTERIVVFAPTTIIGDGSKANPRRITLYNRLDILGRLITDGLICVQPDGTVEDRSPDVLWDGTLVRDLGGSIGIIQHTMRRDFWEMTQTYLTEMLGYPPSVAPSLPELKALATSNRAYLVRELIDRAGVSLPAGPNLRTRVRTFITDLALTGELGELRAYYLDRIDGSVEEWPAFMRGTKQLGDGVDPVRFQKMMERIRTAGDTSPARFLHTLYEVAYLDVIIRAL